MALQVVTANRLGDGRVVFLADGYRWVEEIGLARVGETDEAAKALLAIVVGSAIGCLPLALVGLAGEREGADR